MFGPVVSGGSESPSWSPRPISGPQKFAYCLKWLLPLVIFLGAVGWSSDAHAYAWMMRKGYFKCATCHTDPSGGELLNHMGRVQSEQLLSQRWGEDEGLTSDAKLLYGLDEPDNFRIGGSVRGMAIYTMAKDPAPADTDIFPMQMDVYAMADFGTLKAGASVGYANVPEASPHLRGAQLLKSESGGNVISRTHWIGADLGQRWLLRVGRLNLPFGIRTSEHVLYVRDATKTDRESDQSHGVAFAYSGGRWRGEGMFVLGNYQISPDDYRERGFVGFAEYLIDRDLALGLNTLILQSAKSLLTGSQERTIRHAHGPTLRYVPLQELMLLAELDILKTSGFGMGYVGMLNADYEIFQGLHAGATFEAIDRGLPDGLDEPLPGLGEMQWAAWGSVQWFFYTHWDFRMDALLRQDAATVVQGQVHFYF
jgi:hypothetical protein